MILALLVSAVLAAFGGLLIVPLAVLVTTYVLASLAVSLAIARRRGWRHAFRLPLAFVCMHLAYGLGFLSGLVRLVLRLPVAKAREIET